MMSPEKSIQKMKKKIFSRFTAEDYSILEASEKVRFGDGNAASMGSIEYNVNLAPEITRVVIQHEQKDQFTIHTWGMVQSGAFIKREHSLAAVQANFQDLDSKLMHALKPHWKADGNPAYR